MNVAPLELAIVTRAEHWENRLRICQVIARIHDLNGDRKRSWWLCEFPRPVKTDLGWMFFSCVEDRNLQRIAGETKRFVYHTSHYQLLSALQKTTSPKDAAA